MRAHFVRGCSALVFLALTAVPVRADGLFVKLATEEARVSAAKPVKVRLTAVVTRSFTLPPPQFLIDDGSGLKARPEIEVKALEAAAATVTPGAPFQASWEVVLPHPGHYRIQARYQLADRVVQSNKLAVEVLGTEAAAQGR